MPEGKINCLKKKSKPRNQMWQACWNCQAGDLKQLEMTCQGSLMDQEGNTQKQMSGVNREMEILKTNQTEMIVINNTAPEMKNDFDGLISNRT